MTRYLLLLLLLALIALAMRHDRAGCPACRYVDELKAAHRARQEAH